jgi:KEOPS complex subunit Pcc1
VDAKDKTKAIFDSINTDNKFYPENPTKTKITLKKNQLHISIDASELSQMRANINSILRLVQASYDSVESLEI